MTDKIIENDIVEIINQIDNKRFSGKTILLTGAAGFLGTYFVRYFISLKDNLFNNLLIKHIILIIQLLIHYIYLVLILILIILIFQ